MNWKAILRKLSRRQKAKSSEIKNVLRNLNQKSRVGVGCMVDRQIETLQAVILALSVQDNMGSLRNWTFKELCQQRLVWKGEEKEKVTQSLNMMHTVCFPHPYFFSP